MPNVSDLLAHIEKIAPARYAFSFDNVGLQIGDPEAEITGVVVALDRSLSAIEFAAAKGANVLLTHHPLFFSPIKSLSPTTYEGRCAFEATRRGISVICAHTNWDSARGGINDALADMLSLQNVVPFGTGAEVETFKMVYFVGSRHLDPTLNAVADAGGGKIGKYERCAFYVKGTGTFESDGSANPYVGRSGGRENIDEYRVEVVVPGPLIPTIVRELRAVHPYEEPAIDFFALKPQVEQPAGRIGDVKATSSLLFLNKIVSERLGFPAVSWGRSDKVINRVAVVGGAADGEWRAAMHAGADMLVTGEVKQHIALEASESGFAICQAGHYATEQPGVSALAERMKNVMPEVAWTVYKPNPGVSGRPFSQEDEW